MALTHGTAHAYQAKGCRCDDCKAWRTADSARALARHRANGRPEHGSKQELVHGTGWAYRSQRCRCEACRAWNAERSRTQRAVNARIEAIMAELDLSA